LLFIDRPAPLRPRLTRTNILSRIGGVPEGFSRISQRWVRLGGRDLAPAVRVSNEREPTAHCVGSMV